MKAHENTWVLTGGKLSKPAKYNYYPQFNHCVCVGD